MAARVVQRQH